MFGMTNLGHIKDLDTVARKLTANHHVVLVAPNLLPESIGVDRNIGHRQEAKVLHSSLGQDLDEGCTIVQAAGNELTLGLRIDPTPRRRAGEKVTVRVAVIPAIGRSEGGVVDEVVQINILAAEGVQRVSWDGLGDAIDTLGVVEARPSGAVHKAGIGGSEPRVHLALHVHIVHSTTVVHLGGNDLILGQLLGRDGPGGQDGTGNSVEAHLVESQQERLRLRLDSEGGENRALTDGPGGLLSPNIYVRQHYGTIRARHCM